MAAELLLPTARASDTANSPYSGAQWFFYVKGTLTPQNVYADPELSTSLGATVTADSAGKFVPIYFDASLQYRGICKNATGSVTLHDIPLINTGAFSELAATTGAGLVGFKQPGTGAVNSDVETALREIGRTVTGYGGVMDGATDGTDAFNLMTEASAAYSTDLWGTKDVPHGDLVMGAGNTTGYLRLGQHLHGHSWGTRLNFAANGTNTVPGIIVGQKSDGTPDPAGPPVQVSNLSLYGGAATAPNIYSEAAGAAFFNLFSSAAGVGFDLRGSDTLAYGNIHDLGLNHKWISGFNQVHFGEIFYQGNYQETLKDGSHDLVFTGRIHEYFKYNAVLFQTGASNIRAITQTSTLFMQSWQYGSSDGAVVMRSTDSDYFGAANQGRNLRGPLLRMVGSGNRATLIATRANGLRTTDDNEQSSTMQGVVVEDGEELVVLSDEFTDLPMTPIQIGGSSAINAYIVASVFARNGGDGSLTGSIASTTLTATAIASGNVAVGSKITGAGVTANTVVTAFGTNSFTGSITGTTLTVTAISSGRIDIHQPISGSGILPETYIVGLLSGTGGTGTYEVSDTYASPVPSTTIASTTAGGQGNYTVNNSQTVASEALTAEGCDIFINNSNAGSTVLVVASHSDRPTQMIRNIGAATVRRIVSNVQDTGWIAGTGSINKGGFATYTTGTASAAYSQAEMQGVRDNLDAATRRILALETAVRTAGLIDG